MHVSVFTAVAKLRHLGVMTCFTMAVLLPMPVYANGPTIDGKIALAATTYAPQEIDISKQLAAMQFDMARVLLVDPDRETRFDLDEKALNDIGCTFVGGAPDLAKILTTSHIRTLPPPLKPTFRHLDLRVGIYLRLAEGGWVKLVFGRAFAKRDGVEGSYGDGRTYHNLAITADAGMLEKLYKFEAPSKVPSFMSSPPNEQECRQFLDKYLAK